MGDCFTCGLLSYAKNLFEQANVGRVRFAPCGSRRCDDFALAVPFSAHIILLGRCVGRGWGHSSSRSRRTASLGGFFDLSHTFDGPLR